MGIIHPKLLAIKGSEKNLESIQTYVGSVPYELYTDGGGIILLPYF